MNVPRRYGYVFINVDTQIKPIALALFTATFLTIMFSKCHIYFICKVHRGKSNL